MKHGFILVLPKEKAKNLIKDINRRNYIKRYKKKFKFISLDASSNYKSSLDIESKFNLEEFVLNKILLEKLIKDFKTSKENNIDFIDILVINNLTIREHIKKFGSDEKKIRIKMEKILRNLKIL